MTLLITGAAGTTGTRLAADLAACDIPLQPLNQRPPAETEFAQADLRDLDAIEKTPPKHPRRPPHRTNQHRPFAAMTEHNITGIHHVL
ncbi:hypothetical protein ABT354_30745 [Streptomyces sp. NPDC000594]|uniref:hypothetical protein n=1 Tax=Streptomyces sp. NPDC000594 TaxID=3154261 RepID=UPI00332519C0